MNEHDPYRDRADCKRLAVDCYALMDRGLYEESAALFTDDAIWVRGEGPVKTRVEILASLRRRPPERLSRHLVTNLVATIRGDEAEAYASFVGIHGVRAPEGPARLPVPVAVGDLVYRFRRGPEGWRIAYLEPVILFVPNPDQRQP